VLAGPSRPIWLSRDPSRPIWLLHVSSRIEFAKPIWLRTRRDRAEARKRRRAT
jgi:hypothetical protein